MSSKGMQNISTVEGTYECNKNTDVMLIFFLFKFKTCPAQFNLSIDQVYIHS